MKKKNPFITFLAGLGLAAVGLVICSCLAGLYLSRNSGGPASIALAAGDTDPPHLVALDFAPKTVNTALADQAIAFTVHLTDDLSGVTDGEIGGVGVSPTQARFRSSSGNQLADVLFQPPGDLVSGTKLDGIFVSEMVLPQFCETGTWQLESFLLVDDVGNLKLLDIADVTTLGFPTEFTVTDEVRKMYLPLIIR